MTVQAAKRNANQYHHNGAGSKFSGGGLDEGKTTYDMKSQPHPQKVHMTILEREMFLKS